MRSFRDHIELPVMSGKLVSWDLCFALYTVKFCTCRLHPLGGHTPPASAAWRGRVQPALQCSQWSGIARPGRSLSSLAFQVGPGRRHLPCSPALVSRDELWAPSRRGEWLEPLVRFLKLSLRLERSDSKAEAVRAACAAAVRLNRRKSGLATTSPRPSGSLAHCRALQSWRGRWGSPAAPPRGSAQGAVPGA